MDKPTTVLMVMFFMVLIATSYLFFTGYFESGSSNKAIKK